MILKDFKIFKGFFKAQAIAQQAVDYALKVAKRQDEVGELKLDVGLGAEQLYLSGGAEMRCKWRPKACENHQEHLRKAVGRAGPRATQRVT